MHHISSNWEACLPRPAVETNTDDIFRSGAEGHFLFTHSGGARLATDDPELGVHWGYAGGALGVICDFVP